MVAKIGYNTYVFLIYRIFLFHRCALLGMPALLIHKKSVSPYFVSKMLHICTILKRIFDFNYFE